MKFPTVEEMAQNVAEKALDEWEYKGKTLRQWVKIILATDINVATKLSTNLAEVGTNCSEFPNNSDAISRQAAIDALATMYCKSDEDGYVWIIRRDAWARIDALPSAEPKRGKWIRDGHHIRCDQCGIYMCDTDREGDRIPTDFCPNCGCRMDGGEQ